MTVLPSGAVDPDFGRPYAIAAYVVIFAAFFGYVAYLHVSHRRLSDRLRALEDRLAKGRTRPPG